MLFSVPIHLNTWFDRNYFHISKTIKNFNHGIHSIYFLLVLRHHSMILRCFIATYVHRIELTANDIVYDCVTAVLSLNFHLQDTQKRSL